MTDKTSEAILRQSLVIKKCSIALFLLLQQIERPGGRKAIKQAEKLIEEIDAHLERLGEE